MKTHARNKKERTFPNRTDRLFGREKDLDFLSSRVFNKGVTAVVGRAREGKTWMVEEHCRRLDEEKGWLVGYTCCTGETDSMLYATKDLYLRWFSKDSLAEQARILYNENKDGLAGRISNIMLNVAEILLEQSGPVGAVFNKAMKYLRSQDERLKTGPISVPPLNYSQCRELACLLKEVTGSPGIFFVIDSWERSPNPEREIALFERFMDNAISWPLVHFLLVVRDAPTTQIHCDLLRNLERDRPEVKIHQLSRMRLNVSETNRLHDYLKKSVPSLSRLEPKVLVDSIDGYAGILERLVFLGQSKTEKPFTMSDLDCVVKEARECRYSEIDYLMPKLESDELSLVSYLALGPEITNSEQWENLAEVFMELIQSEDVTFMIEKLRDIRLLDRRNRLPPFGHSTRHKAVQEWLFHTRDFYVLRKVESLIVCLASHVLSYNEECSTYIESLISMTKLTKGLDLPQLHASLCLAATTLRPRSDGPVKIEDVSFRNLWKEIAKNQKKLAPLASMAVLNTLEQFPEEKDNDAQDFFRSLVKDYPDLPITRIILAKALINMTVDSAARKNWDYCDQIFQELKELHDEYENEEPLGAYLGAAIGLIAAFSEPKEARIPLHFLNRYRSILEMPSVLNGLGTMIDEGTENEIVFHTYTAALCFHLFKFEFQKGEPHSAHVRDYEAPERDVLLEKIRNLTESYPAGREMLVYTLHWLISAAEQKRDHYNYNKWFEELLECSSPLTENSHIRVTLFETCVSGITSGLYAKEEAEILEHMEVVLTRHQNDRALLELYILGVLGIVEKRRERGEVGSTLNLLVKVDGMPLELCDRQILAMFSLEALKNITQSKQTRQKDKSHSLLNMVLRIIREYLDEKNAENLIFEVASLLKESLRAEDEEDADRFLFVLWVTAERFDKDEYIVSRLKLGLYMAFSLLWEWENNELRIERLKDIDSFKERFANGKDGLDAEDSLEVMKEKYWRESEMPMSASLKLLNKIGQNKKEEVCGVLKKYADVIYEVAYTNKAEVPSELAYELASVIAL